MCQAGPSVQLFCEIQRFKKANAPWLPMREASKDQGPETGGTWERKSSLNKVTEDEKKYRKVFGHQASYESGATLVVEIDQGQAGVKVIKKLNNSTI